MKYAVLGTGMVGITLASRLVQLGHDVGMGARETANEKAVHWAASNGPTASSGNFAEVASRAEIIVLATAGGAVKSVASEIGGEISPDKVIIDVTNPLDFSRGMPPSLLPELSGTTSAAETLQAALPDARVVKALNTMNHLLMVDPTRISGAHDVFLCGNDPDAKAQVVTLLKAFGWTAPIDLGALSAARGLEGLMPFWLSVWAATGSADFNYHIARA